MSDRSWVAETDIADLDSRRQGGDGSKRPIKVKGRGIANLPDDIIMWRKLHKNIAPLQSIGKHEKVMVTKVRFNPIPYGRSELR